MKTIIHPITSPHVALSDGDLVKAHGEIGILVNTIRREGRIVQYHVHHAGMKNPLPYHPSNVQPYEA